MNMQINKTATNNLACAIYHLIALGRSDIFLYTCYLFANHSHIQQLCSTITHHRATL